jgi:hypothetical protein
MLDFTHTELCNINNGYKAYSTSDTQEFHRLIHTTLTS